jgi:hypothetical protein
MSAMIALYVLAGLGALLVEYYVLHLLYFVWRVTLRPAYDIKLR